MRSSTGRWVSGSDFFDRENELRQLEDLVRDRNHVLLTGQRRMGKTSIVRELGHRLESLEWIFLFVDVEGASCPEDVIADIAEAAYPYAPIAHRFTTRMSRWVRRFEEVGAAGFRLKVRAGLDAGSWRRQGEQLFRACARQDRPVFVAIDELPIFLKRMLQRDGDAGRVDQFLSWLRSVLQTLGDGSPVLLVSGSIGLEPLVRRLGLPDRINHLYPVRLGPWDRDTSIACFDRLAASNALTLDDGVGNAVYEALGLGVPQHIQSFFARLRDFATLRKRERLTVADVDTVYRVDAETATQGAFTGAAHRRLAALYSRLVDDAPARIANALDILVHDTYLEPSGDAHRFQSRLLRDWWSARFRDHYVPLHSRRDIDRDDEPAP